MVGGSDDGIKSSFNGFIDAVNSMVEGPVVWFKKSIVEPNQKQYNWYHQKFRRVPTIDQCYDDDIICQHEADHQFKRDKQVDSQVLNILRQRYEDCMFYEVPDSDAKCEKLYQMYEEAAANWFIKYGDLGVVGLAEAAYMKQKHRMVWERRHGPVGTGTEGNRPESNIAEPE